MTITLRQRVCVAVAAVATAIAMVGATPPNAPASPSVTTKAAPKPVIHARPIFKSAVQGRSIEVWGQVTHVSKPATRVVRFQRLNSKKRWVTTNSTRPKADGSIHAKAKVPAKIGTYKYRSALFASAKKSARLLDTDRFPVRTIRYVPKAVDASCTSSNLYFNVSHRGYVAQAEVGLVGWRIYANLNLRDLCDHGSISGTVGIYKANIEYKKGQYSLSRQFYARSSEGKWTSDGLATDFFYSGGGWDLYNVHLTGDNIGMSKQTYFSYTTIGSSLWFNGVGSSQKWDTCTRNQNRWDC